MVQYIDKDSLIAEIERLSDANLSHLNNEQKSMYLNVIGLVKTAINTLEVKEVDLEKEYEEFVVDDPILGNFITNDTMGIELAKHFFELGLKVQKGE